MPRGKFTLCGMTRQARTVRAIEVNRPYPTAPPRADPAFTCRHDHVRSRGAIAHFARLALLFEHFTTPILKRSSALDCLRRQLLRCRGTRIAKFDCVPVKTRNRCAETFGKLKAFRQQGTELIQVVRFWEWDAVLAE